MLATLTDVHGVRIGAGEEIEVELAVAGVIVFEGAVELIVEVGVEDDGWDDNVRRDDVKDDVDGRAVDRMDVH